MAQLKNTTIDDTGFLNLPVGTTAERPASPLSGMVRYNTTTNQVEYYDIPSSAWTSAGYLPPVATGGVITTVNGYRIHVFNKNYSAVVASGGTASTSGTSTTNSFTTAGSSTFVLTSATQSSITFTRGGEVEYLIVAGGGAGGNCQDNGGLGAAGGGAGGVLFGKITVAAETYPVLVGAGGTATNSTVVQGGNGENSSVFGLNAIGGGAGGGDSVNYRCSTGSDEAGRRRGCPGGSGGGSGAVAPGGVSTAGQGNPGGQGNSAGVSWGGAAGGGGGAGQAGSPWGDGGAGISSNILGTTTFYAGGGGAGGNASTSGRPGGIGGGGRGIDYREGVVISAANGTNGTGGGGGGTPANQGVEMYSGRGGDGIVIIYYKI
jgi:hypothetical protein